MALTWTATLKDEISPAAHRAAGALDSMDSALRKVSKDGSHVGAVASSIDKVASAVKKAASDLGGAQSKALGFSDGLKQWGSDISSGLIELGPEFAAVGAAAIAATTAIAGIAYKGASMVLDANRFKDDTLDGFKAIVGTDEAAQRIWEMASRTSLEVAGDLKTTMEQMNQLLSQGFTAEMADNIVRAMADVKAMDPKANVEGIADAFAKIQSQGSLTEKQLKSTALAMHVTTDAVKEALANDLHKTKAEIEQLLKGGKIDAGAAEKALLEALQKKTGKGLGGGAKEANDDVYGMIERMKNLKDQMLANANVDWSPLASAMEKVKEVLEGSAGQEFMKAAVGGINDIVVAIGNVKKEDIAFVFHAASVAIREMSGYLVKVIGGIEEAASAMRVIAGGIDRASDAWDRFKDATVGIPVLGAMIQDIGGSFTDLAVKILNPVTAISGLGQALVEFGADLLSSLKRGIDEAIGGAETEAGKIGTAIIDGIVSGITGGAASVAAAVKGVADGAIDAFRGPDGIDAHSPSERFRRAAFDAPAGAARGFQDGTRDVVGAATDMANRALEPMRAGNAAAKAVSNNTTSNTRAFTGNVTIYANGSGGGLGREMEDALRSLNNAFGF